MGEIDPNGKKAGEPGAKLDDGKQLASSGLIEYFPRALSLVADVSTFGAKKYTEGGWKTVPNGEKRYRNAGVRHQLKMAAGEVVDPDSNLPHVAHYAWNILAEIELRLIREEAVDVVQEKPKGILHRLRNAFRCKARESGSVEVCRAPINADPVSGYVPAWKPGRAVGSRKE